MVAAPSKETDIDKFLNETGKFMESVGQGEVVQVGGRSGVAAVIGNGSSVSDHPEEVREMIAEVESQSEVQHSSQ